MGKIFIAHAWSNNKYYNQKQLDFIRKLELELNDKDLEVTYDGNNVDKIGLNSFMRENIKNCDIILAICDDIYFQKSDEENTGVFFELKEITEHNFLDKVIPIKIAQCKLPYQFGTLEYENFQNEFDSLIIDSTDALKKLFVRLAKKLSMPTLCPNDSLKPEVCSKLDSLDLITNILSADSKLSDFYTYPEFRVDGTNCVSHVSSKRLINEKFYLNKVYIIGDRQSGKTSFSKRLFLDIYNSELQPVFLEKKDINSQNIDKAVRNKYIDIYSTTHKNEKKNIVLIVDDFHMLPPRFQTAIKNTEGYAGVVLFIDDIYDITTKDFSISRYSIMPFKPTLRNELIGKIIDSQANSNILNQNDRLKKIDESSNLVNISLGLGRGYRNGIIPAFPLYILIILGANTDLSSRLDSPMSSYGHCYQLLIGLAFQNCGVNNDRIESYMNFLSYFAMYLFKKGKFQVSTKEFDLFLEEYQNDFTIFDLEQYISQLMSTGIVKKTNSSNYGFCYEYLYYFFLGKFLSEHFDDCLESITNIISHLDVEENGHISIFLAHHCKDNRLIQMLNNRLEISFKYFKVAKLNSQELGGFDEQVTKLSSNIEYKLGNHNEERKNRLEQQDRYEYNSYQEKEEIHESKEKEESRQNEVRCAIQTVEVIGVILKNRYGSIKKADFDIILKNTVDANLRLLTSFIEIVSDKEFISLLENFISNEITIEDVDEVKLRNEIHDMLVGMNFATIYAIIMKTISSIGSEYISRYFSKVFDDSNLDPSYILIQRGLEMQYEKHFAEDEILKEINSAEMSHVARTILNLFVVNHISTHFFNYKEKSRIEKKFGYSPNTLLKREQQIKSLESR